MPGRGPQTFKKRQKEQERKERQQEKMAKRLQRKVERANGTAPEHDDDSPDDFNMNNDSDVEDLNTPDLNTDPNTKDLNSPAAQLREEHS